MREAAEPYANLQKRKGGVLIVLQEVNRETKTEGVSAEKRSRRRAKVKLPLRAYLLYVLVATLLCTGVTFSKYVTPGVADDSARVAQIGDLVITENGDFTEKADGNHAIFIPGVDLEKDARLRFDGAEFACYVFLEVTAGGWSSSDNRNYQAAAGKISWAVDDGWTYLQTEGNSRIYYVVVPAGNPLPSKVIIRDSVVTVGDDLCKEDIADLPALSMTFNAAVVQLDGFGDYDTEAEHAAAAWSSVSAH